jgi:hypothetical protein
MLVGPNPDRYFRGGLLNPGDLRSYVSGWEKPGWTPGQYYDMGVFNAQSNALRDMKGLFEENKWPDLPDTGYPYWSQKALRDEAADLPYGERRTELMTKYHEVLKNFGDVRLEKWNMLAQVGTPYADVDNLYSAGEKTPYGIATSDSMYTSPTMRQGSFVNYDDTTAYYGDILDKTSRYYSPEADHIWNISKQGVMEGSGTYTTLPQSYFRLDIGNSGIETENRAYWTTPSPEHLALLTPKDDGLLDIIGGGFPPGMSPGDLATWDV